MGYTFRFITPEDDGMIKNYWNEAVFLHQFVPHPLTLRELKSFLRTARFSHTLAYCNDTLVGMFSIGEFKHSAELHGIIRQDLNQLFTADYRKIKRFLILTVFDYIFAERAKEKIILKATPENSGVRGLVRMFQGRQLKHTDNGCRVYIIHRSQYIRFLNNIKNTQSNNEGEGNHHEFGKETTGNQGASNSVNQL